MTERLKKIRKALNLTQGEFAKKLNLQQNTICLFETGKRNPSERTLEDICNIFHVSKDYLLEGTEPMFIETPSSTMEQLRKEFNLDDFSYNLVYEYLKLEQDQRKWFRDFLYRVTKDGDSATLHELTINPDKLTTADAEAEYKKSFSASAHRKDSPASSTTDGTADDTRASNE